MKMFLFGGILLDTFVKVFDGTLIRDRSLDIIQTHDLNEIQSGCQVLFVGHDKRQQALRMLKIYFFIQMID